MADAPPGWYPDPEGLTFERYFDGAAWTAQTRSQPSAHDAPSSLGKANEALKSQSSSLYRSAENFSTIVATIAALVLLLGLAGAAIIVFAVIVGHDDYGNPLREAWPYMLVVAGVLLLNSIIAWVLVRSLAMISAYVALRARKMASGD